MAYTFSSYQIAEMAVGVEENGARFYKNLARLIDDKTIKDVFHFLSKQELEHMRSFKSIALTVKRYDSLDEYAIDIQKHTQGLIDDFTDSTFGLEVSEVASIDIKKSLEIAERVERKFIQMYSEMHKSLIDKYRDVLERILEQEREHLKIILDVRKKLGL